MVTITLKKDIGSPIRICFANDCVQNKRQSIEHRAKSRMCQTDKLALTR